MMQQSEIQAKLRRLLDEQGGEIASTDDGIREMLGTDDYFAVHHAIEAMRDAKEVGWYREGDGQVNRIWTK